MSPLKAPVLTLAAAIWLGAGACGRSREEALACNDRGYARFLRGDVRGAIADYDEALRLDPSCALALINRGNAKGKLGDYSGCIADFDAVLRLDPESGDAYINRGNAKYLTGDYPGAVSDLERGLQLRPGYREQFGPMLEKARARR